MMWWDLFLARASHVTLLPDPRIEATRATTFQINGVAGHYDQIVLQAGSGDQAIDYGQRLAACFRFANHRTPTGRNNCINPEHPITESIREFATHPLFEHSALGRIG